MTDKNAIGLSPVAWKFILHWGEMGTRWGINRTVAQIDALLFISPRPLHAEEIAQTLGVVRSNVSTSLKELQGWGIVRKVHVMGDRRDHFEVTTKDVWETFRQVLDERKKREIDPTVALLRECVAEAAKGGTGEQRPERSGGADPPDRYAAARLTELLSFFETTTAWYEQMRKLPAAAVVRFMKLGDRIRKLLGVG
jgi:DNA-binding transcriptional regulator GbsR (MarR family)